MGVWNQDNTARRKRAHQCLPNQFGIGVSQRLIRDSPDLPIGVAQAFASEIQFRTPPGDDGCWGLSSINLRSGDRQFRRRVVGHAVLVYDVSENTRHYFKPPLAFTNSITLSTISSLLPLSISAPFPIAGTK